MHVVFFGNPMPDSDSPDWVASPYGFALPQGSPPTLLDQIVVVAQESDLGLQSLTEEQIRALLAPIPLAPALAWTSRHLLRLWDADDEVADQIELAQRLFDPDAPIIERCRAFLAEGEEEERRVLFSEQQFHVLLRLCFESCADAEEDTTWDQERETAMRRALLGVTSITGEGAARLGEDSRSLEDWLGYFTQNGAYNSKEQPLLAYQRVLRVFVELAGSEAAREHPAFLDFDALSRDALGASVLELLSVAFAAFAGASRDEDPGHPGNFGVVRNFVEYLRPTAIGDRATIFAEALSAPRHFYIGGFERSRDDPVRLAWDITPIQQKPFFQLPENGPMLLLSPRGISSWLTDGVYYRLLDAAADQNHRNDFTTFVGWLYERYLLEIFELALPGRPAGEGRVHEEIKYGGELTSDISIDYGSDLVLFEVVSTRLPLGVRAEADEAELERFLNRAVLDKLHQLDRVITDLGTGKVGIPDVEIGAVKRIWPVLVNVGEMTEGEVLYEFIKRKAPDVLAQPGCQALTLLGVDDAEVLAGVAASGEDIPDVLAAKAADGYQAMGLARWVLDKRTEIPPRLTALEQRWQQLTEEMIAILRLPPRLD